MPLSALLWGHHESESAIMTQMPQYIMIEASEIFVYSSSARRRSGLYPGSRTVRPSPTRRVRPAAAPGRGRGPAAAGRIMESSCPCPGPESLWPFQNTWDFPSQFIKSTKVLMATSQGRRLGYHTTEQVSNPEPPDSRLCVLTTTRLGRFIVTARHIHSDAAAGGAVTHSESL